MSNDGIQYHVGDGRRVGRVTMACDNVIAWQLGEACNKAAQASAGDLIDRGLGLVAELEKIGFSVHKNPPKS